MSDYCEISCQMQAIQERLNILQQQLAQTTARNALLTTAGHELAIALEELQGVTEAQRQQNQALLATQQALTKERQRYQTLVDFAPDAYLMTDATGRIQAVNQAAEKLLNVRRDLLVDHCLSDYVVRGDWSLIEHQLNRRFPSAPPISQPTQRRDPAGTDGASMARAIVLLQNQAISLQPRHQNPLPTCLYLSGECNAEGRMVQLCWVFRDITERQQNQEALNYQASRDQLVAAVAQDIRQSLELNTVLARTVRRVRALFKTDRVIICRYEAGERWTVIKESVGQRCLSMLSTVMVHPASGSSGMVPDRHGQVTAIEDVDQAELDPWHLELLQRFEVKAKLVAPILQGSTLWGMLSVHQCSAPRPWQPLEIDLLKQLATHVSIAIQQSELYEQTWHQLAEIETIYNTAPIGLAALDTDLRFVRVNQYLADTNGLSIADHLGHNTFETVPHLAEQLEPRFRQVLDTGEPILNVEIEGETAAQPGVRRTWLESWIPLKNPEGQISGINLVVLEITKRKQIDAKIREQAALLDITPDAIFVRDLDHRILYWNRGAEHLYGWTAQEAIGQRVDELLRCGAELLTTITQEILNQGDWQGEIRDLTKTGQPVTVWARWTLVRDEVGRPQSILSVITDITAKKQLEAQYYQAQRLEMLGALASGIAHDLNNVLSPILAMSQLLRMTQQQLNPVAQEQLQLIEKSAKRGAAMVKQILTLTRGSNEEPTQVLIVPLLQEVTSIVKKSFPKSITVDVDSFERADSQPAPLAVMADPTHLHQVVMNLCINARDAMPDGGYLTLAAYKTQLDATRAKFHLDARVGDYVVITVADTGTGIVPEVRDRMFDPFFTTKAPGKGTGLGLATVLGIIKTYGGFLQVASEVGQGTQINVCLPALEAASAHRPRSSDPLQTDLSGDGELILIVEDDPTVQSTTQSLLENHCYATLVANDGLEGLNYYIQQQHDIGLVILDVTMPKMSGIELIQRLKAVNPAVKIIAISGLPTNRKSAVGAGANVFLAKPYALPDLLTEVSRLLRAS